MADLKMPDINNVIIVGNLIKDPIIRATTNGTPVSNFTIASNRKFKDNFGQWKEDVCFIGIVAWYKLAESCGDNLHKGSAVLVEGELQSRQLRTDDGHYRNIVEIKARRIQFLNKREMILSDMEMNTRAAAQTDPEAVPAAQVAAEGETLPGSEDKPDADDREDVNSEEKDKGDDVDESSFDFGFRELKL